MAKNRKDYIGIDLGGTSLRAGVVAHNGEVLGLEKRKTKPELGAQGVLDRMAEAVRKAMKAAGVKPRDVGGIGVGVPGPIDREAGMVRLAVNLGPSWTNLHLAEELSERLGGLP